MRDCDERLRCETVRPMSDCGACIALQVYLPKKRGLAKQEKLGTTQERSIYTAKVGWRSALSRTSHHSDALTDKSTRSLSALRRFCRPRLRVAVLPHSPRLSRGPLPRGLGVAASRLQDPLARRGPACAERLCSLDEDPLSHCARSLDEVPCSPSLSLHTAPFVARSLPSPACRTTAGRTGPSTAGSALRR